MQRYRICRKDLAIRADDGEWCKVADVAEQLADLMQCNDVLRCLLGPGDDLGAAYRKIITDLEDRIAQATEKAKLLTPRKP